MHDHITNRMGAFIFKNRFERNTVVGRLPQPAGSSGYVERVGVLF